jgi:hypothetical protein
MMHKIDFTTPMERNRFISLAVTPRGYIAGLVTPAQPTSSRMISLYSSTSFNGGLVPDLSSGRGKLIGGDLNVDNKGSEQNFKPLQSLHHHSVGYQSALHELSLPRWLIPASTIENTSKNEVDAI